jgi:DNA-binding transcriptional LysR family regulator
MRFDLVDLRLHLNVVETLSITAGAQRSNMALASASARIRKLEQNLGSPLFVRGRRGVSVTPAGHCLADHARIVSHQLQQLQDDLGTYARGLRGSVRILSNTAAFSEHLPHPLASFLAEHPAISVELEESVSEDIGAAVAVGAADVGIASQSAISDTLQRFDFRSDRLVIVAPRGDPISTKRPIRFANLTSRDFVGLSRESALQRHLAGHAARLGTPLNLRVRVGSFDAVCRMVEAGVGIGIVPAIAANRCRRSMTISVAPLADDWAARQLAICVRSLKGLPPFQRRSSSHIFVAPRHPDANDVFTKRRLRPLLWLLRDLLISQGTWTAPGQR